MFIARCILTGGGYSLKMIHIISLLISLIIYQISSSFKRRSLIYDISYILYLDKLIRCLIYLSWMLNKYENGVPYLLNIFKLEPWFLNSITVASISKYIYETQWSDVAHAEPQNVRTDGDTSCSGFLAFGLCFVVVLFIMIVFNNCPCHIV